jgi:hypothetical protein
LAAPRLRQPGLQGRRRRVAVACGQVETSQGPWPCRTLLATSRGRLPRTLRAVAWSTSRSTVSKTLASSVIDSGSSRQGKVAGRAGLDARGQSARSSRNATDPVTGALLDLRNFGLLSAALFILVRRRRPCGCRQSHPRKATRRYSLIVPPTRVCLRTRYCPRMTGCGSGFSAAAEWSERCGRC